ncbi:hypothetical protein B0T21DRAFT_444919 [Apiosordaria backusii]|uniref:Uncharacterized protein n=1 Tax=Apiosordaria backusii TaxID=314023 RepID=A0AA40B802_9PEZI|nr:hypothetical protein B0T21DRAFT_444919 [Apiosordaria backusii]
MKHTNGKLEAKIQALKAPPRRCYPRGGGIIIIGSTTDRDPSTELYCKVGKVSGEPLSFKVLTDRPLPLHSNEYYFFCKGKEAQGGGDTRHKRGYTGTGMLLDVFWKQNNCTRVDQHESERETGIDSPFVSNMPTRTSSPLTGNPPVERERSVLFSEDGVHLSLSSAPGMKRGEMPSTQSLVLAWSLLPKQWGEQVLHEDESKR